MAEFLDKNGLGELCKLIVPSIAEAESAANSAVTSIKDKKLMEAPKMEIMKIIPTSFAIVANSVMGEDVQNDIRRSRLLKISHPNAIVDSVDNHDYFLAIMRYSPVNRKVNYRSGFDGLTKIESFGYRDKCHWHFFKGQKNKIVRVDSSIATYVDVDNNLIIPMDRFINLILNNNIVRVRKSEIPDIIEEYGEDTVVYVHNIEYYDDEYDVTLVVYNSNNEQLDERTETWYYKDNRKILYIPNCTLGIALVRQAPNFYMRGDERETLAWSGGHYRWIFSDVVPFELCYSGDMDWSYTPISISMPQKKSSVIKTDE